MRRAKCRQVARIISAAFGNWNDMMNMQKPVTVAALAVPIHERASPLIFGGHRVFYIGLKFGARISGDSV